MSNEYLFEEPPSYSTGWDQVRDAALRSQTRGEPSTPTQYCNVNCSEFGCRPSATLERVQTAIKRGHSISAHPGIDFEFTRGRDITPDDVYAVALCQLGALKGVVDAEGGRISAVKPHGLLFILLRDRADLMRAFLKAQVGVLGRDIPMCGLAYSYHEAIAAEVGVPFIGEVTVEDGSKPPAWTPTGSPNRSRSQSPAPSKPKNRGQQTSDAPVSGFTRFAMTWQYYTMTPIPTILANRKANGVAASTTPRAAQAA